jgi:cyclophilin family peptidyl-prolyl cis-trans isomerase
MVQCGGMDAAMKEKSTRAPVTNEGMNGLKNMKYTLAMARTSAPDSATAQFFINTADNDFLNASAGKPGYAVFGKVTKGTEIVDKIGKVKTGNKGMHGDVPAEPITITGAKILN